MTYQIDIRLQKKHVIIDRQFRLFVVSIYFGRAGGPKEQVFQSKKKRISEEKAGEVGINALVFKPFVTRDFTLTVRKVLDEK